MPLKFHVDLPVTGGLTSPLWQLVRLRTIPALSNKFVNRQELLRLRWLFISFTLAPWSQALRAGSAETSLAIFSQGAG